jgi:hypothetical protein
MSVGACWEGPKIPESLNIMEHLNNFNNTLGVDIGGGCSVYLKV